MISLACPLCYGDLRNVMSSLICARCDARFPIADGVPNLTLASTLTADQARVARDWDAMADQYHAIIRGIGNRADAIDRPLLEIATGAVVEVGCGDGRFLARLRAHGVRDALGVDISSAMASLAARNGHRVVVAPAESLPLADRSIDCCLSAYYSLRYADLDRAMAEFGRVLRPGGRFGFTLLGARATRFSAAIVALPLLFHQETTWTAADTIVGRARGIVLPNDVRDVDELRKLCLVNALTTDRITGFARAPYLSGILDRFDRGALPVPSNLIAALAYDIVVIGHRSVL